MAAAGPMGRPWWPGGAPVWQQGGHPQNEGGLRAALTEKGPPLGPPFEKGAARRAARRQGRQAGPGGPSGRPSGQVAALRAARARPKGGQSRAREREGGAHRQTGREGRPRALPEHSVKCAGSSKTNNPRVTQESPALLLNANPANLGGTPQTTRRVGGTPQTTRRVGTPSRVSRDQATRSSLCWPNSLAAFVTAALAATTSRAMPIPFTGKCDFVYDPEGVTPCRDLLLPVTEEEANEVVSLVWPPGFRFGAATSAYQVEGAHRRHQLEPVGGHAGARRRRQGDGAPERRRQCRCGQGHGHVEPL